MKPVELKMIVNIPRRVYAASIPRDVRNTDAPFFIHDQEPTRTAIDAALKEGCFASIVIVGKVCAAKNRYSMRLCGLETTLGFEPGVKDLHA
jgi:hypothetical protein